MRRGAALLAVVFAALPVCADAATAATAHPLTVRAVFVPGVVEFGDAVTARIVVTLDRDSVRTSSLRVVYGVAPLTQLGRTRERHVNRGNAQIVTYELRAACLTDPCVAASARRSVAPAPVQAVVARTTGATVHAAAAWVPLTVSGRVTAADLSAASPPFRVDTAPPAPSYRVRPSLLGALLDGAGAILVACAVGLAAAALLRARRPRHAGQTDELTHALELARAARTRAEPDRRAAVGYLARLLARRGTELAPAADDLAWSRPAPTPDSLTALVEDVERERPA
jgi:hypothetical protein